MIRLAPLPVEEVARVLHLRIAPGQEAFVAPIGRMVAERHRGVAFHVIERRGEPVGFFKIDSLGAIRPPYAAEDEIGLRGFLVGAQYQRQGIGTQAARLLGPYLSGLYPDATGLVLTVGVRNRPAQRVYFAAGMIDTGVLWHRGRAGPEHVLRLPLAGS